MAPFCLVVSSNDRILVFGDIRKCAILLFRLALQRGDCSSNLGKAHLADVTGGHAQGVQGLRGIEIHDAAEFKSSISSKKLFSL